MKIQPDMVKIQKFQAQNKRQQLVQLDRVIDEFEQVILTLEQQIAAHRQHSGNHPHDHFSQMNVAKAACQRRDNLRQSLAGLKKQRESAAAELVEMEISQQNLAARQRLSQRTSHSASPAMI